MLRLKERPIEWIKFTGVIGLAVNIVCWLLWWRGTIPFLIPITAACLALGALSLSVVRPHWFRGFYRRGMTVSFHIGQTVGKVLLTLFFFLAVTPMGLLLRLLGKDLLRLRIRPEAKTHWQPARSTREFDRMF